MESPAPLWQKGRDPASCLPAAMGRITGVIGVVVIDDSHNECRFDNRDRKLDVVQQGWPKITRPFTTFGIALVTNPRRQRQV